MAAAHAAVPVGDKCFLRHGSVEYAAMLKKHRYPPLRAFRVVENMPEYNALHLDTRGTGIQPVLKIFDDSSLTSGTFAALATTVAMACGNPHELSGKIT
eukprot:3019953-Pleurochrysis_carterae.AAC.3